MFDKIIRQIKDHARSIVIDDELNNVQARSFCNSLEHNRRIITIRYNKENFTTQHQNFIQAILERNANPSKPKPMCSKQLFI